MNNQKQENYIDGYVSKIEAMDKESSTWGSNLRSEYERNRDTFRKRLDTWQDIAEDKWDDFKSGVDKAWMNIEQGWNQMKERGANEARTA